MQEASDGPAAAAHAIALLSAMRSTLAAGRHALCELPASLLARPAVAEQVPDGAWLAVTGAFEPGESIAGALTQWRTRGVKLGAADGAPEPPGASFVLLRPGADGLNDVLNGCVRWQQTQPARTRVAVDLPGVEAIEQALECGVALAAGRVESGDAAFAQRRTVQPATQRLCQLLNDVVADRDTAHLGAELRADLALSYRLLRSVNSPAVGLSKPIESIEQAVMVLGRGELYRWLSVLLTASGSGRKASRALQEVSLARAPARAAGHGSRQCAAGGDVHRRPAVDARCAAAGAAGRSAAAAAAGRAGARGAAVALRPMVARPAPGDGDRAP